MIERVLMDMGVRVPYKTVWAAEGKRTRAEPVATLAEQGHVHHVGTFPELEDQQVSFIGAPNEKSPDRLDSYVWTLSEFTGLSFTPTSSSGSAVVPYTDHVTSPAVVRWS